MLRAQPPSPTPHDAAACRSRARARRPSSGMWVFLATEVLFFGGLFVAYLYGRTH